MGDIAFSTAQGLPGEGLERALAPVRHQLRMGDLTIGNLEGTLSTGGTSKCGDGGGGSCFAFQAPLSYASAMKAVGFELLNQANNHALDYGAGAQRETIAALDRNGISHTGRPGEIAIRVINRLRVASLGFAPYPWANSLTDIGAAQERIRKAKRHADLVVVIIHAGAEGANRTHTPRSTEYFLGENRGDPRRFAHAAIDAGASIVLGSGPHVIRGIERYKHHLIAYSLGNFASSHTLALGGRLSLSAILRVTLTAKGRVLKGRWVSLRLQDPGLPRLDPSHASARLVGELSREDFGAHRYKISTDGKIRADSGRAA